MSQSFVNTNSFPVEFGLGSPRAWVWPKFAFDPLSGCQRFLRHPGPEDKLGYRMIRVGVIVALRVKGLWPA